MALKFPFSFWLSPEKTAFTKLDNQIKTLCQQFGATSFAPHVTLFVGEHGADENMCELGGKLANSANVVVA